MALEIAPIKEWHTRRILDVEAARYKNHPSISLEVERLAFGGNQMQKIYIRYNSKRKFGCIRWKKC
jgi:hypothetical protein